MNILLINPPNNHTISGNVPDYVMEKSGHLPPLGLLFLATYIKECSQHSVTIYDAPLEENDYQSIAQEAPKYDVIGITVLSFCLVDVMKTIQAIRAISTSTPIILGGPHIAIYPEESLQWPGVSFCLKGESEKTFVQLVTAIEENNTEAYKTIPGLYWKDDIVHSNPTAPFISSLDDLPMPDRSLLQYKRYHSVLSSEKQDKSYVTTAFSSRGCPYKCTFCDRPTLGKKFRSHSANRVIDEIEDCLRLDINEIFFYDDTFTVNRSRVEDICNRIIEKKLNILWDIRARVDTVDESLLKLMKRAGCARIHLGVEAANPEMMEVLKKEITQEQAIAAFCAARKAGIETLGYFMFGCPGETESQMQETMDFAIKLNPDYAHFAILTPFPGTPIYIDALEQGLLKEDYWQIFSRNPDPSFVPPFMPNTLPRDKLLAILEKAYKSFYLRPRYILKESIKIQSFADLVKKFNVATRIVFK